MAYPFPSNEAERLDRLVELNVLDTAPELKFEKFCLFTKEYFDVFACALSLVDKDRLWFKAQCGLELGELPREVAFCNYTILADRIFVVEDTLKDPRFCTNPLVTMEPYIRFYAGAPLIVAPNVRLGALCLIDTRPRTLSERDRATLAIVAGQVAHELRTRATSSSGYTSPNDSFFAGSGVLDARQTN